MTDYLLAIAIGPVQSFIAAARKTRDLWFGSDLLSNIAKQVTQEVQARCAERGYMSALIFPASLGSDNAPNKLLLAIGGSDAAGMQDLSDLASTAATGYLQGRLVPIQRRLRMLRVADALPAQADPEVLIDAQVAHFVECYSAWLSYDPLSYDSLRGYKAKRTELDRLLDGRKLLRDFPPAAGSWALREGRPKSALDPSRESVIWYHQEPNEVVDPRNERICRTLQVKRHEHLDGISLIKRLSEQQRFVSTARVAIDPFIRRLKGSDTLATLNRLAGNPDSAALVERFNPDFFPQYEVFPYDTQLFYGRLTLDDATPPTPAQQEQADQFFSMVRNACAELHIGDLPAYYAILVADGDGMGAIIRETETVEQHQALSRALAEFATEAGMLVTRHQGALVYSGGDDVLAFLPLDTVLGCADALRQAFHERLLEVTGAPHLSVGVAIVHYSEPLNEALVWARNAEKAAKQARKGGAQKNALAVALHTRSGGGEDVTVVHQWNETDAGPVRDYWNLWIDAHRTQALPDGAAYELRRLAEQFLALRAQFVQRARALPPGEAGEPERELLRTQLRAFTPWLQAEVTRILKRKRAEGGTRALTLAEIEGISARLVAVPEYDPLNALGALGELGRITDEIIIARRLAQVADIAEGRAVSSQRRMEEQS